MLPSLIIIFIEATTRQIKEHVFEECQSCDSLCLFHELKLFNSASVCQADAHSAALEGWIRVLPRRFHQVLCLDEPEGSELCVKQHDIRICQHHDRRVELVFVRVTSTQFEGTVEVIFKASKFMNWLCVSRSEGTIAFSANISVFFEDTCFQEKCPCRSDLVITIVDVAIYATFDAFSSL